MVSPLTRAYQAELKRTRLAVVQRVSKNWKKLSSFRDDQVPGFLAATLPIVLAGQSRAVALTDAYLSKNLGVAPVGLDVSALTGSNVRNGVPPETVYERPFITVRSSIKKIGYAAAFEKGLSRLAATADLDVALAGRNANLAFGNSVGGKISGWLRVADPGCCDFCQEIDGTQTGPNEPAPLHNRCGCTVDPITDSSFSSSALLAIGTVIGSTIVREHGELGPVITRSEDNFTDLEDLDNPSYLDN